MTTADNTGLVIWTMGHQARILIGEERFHLAIPGKWRLNLKANRPLAPGDRVSVTHDSNGWRLKERLPRHNEFTRRLPGNHRSIPQVMAANLDLVIIVASVKAPRTAPGLIDRLLVSAALGGVPAMLIINKIDLTTEQQLAELEELYKNAVEQVIFTNAITGDNLEPLREIIAGKTVLLAGPSGTGKSTIANYIDPNLNIKVGEISQATGKGKHTTTTAELHAVEGGGWLTDTPGLRECGPYGKTAENLAGCFPEIKPFIGDCKFRDCVHNHEIGCHVTDALARGEIPVRRYNSYLKMLAEAIEENKPEQYKKT